MAQQRERRSVSRTAIKRRAMFVAVDGSTLLQTGIVTDMGRDGLHLRTRQPAPVGAIIEVEIDPREGSPQSGPIITRGRVVRVQDLANGEYSVGVRLRYRAARKQPIRERNNASTPLKPKAAAHSKKNSKWRERAGKLDWRTWAMTGLFALIVGLLLLWPRDVSRAANSSGPIEWNTLFSEKPIAEKRTGPESSGNSVPPIVPRGSAGKKHRERVSLLDELKPDDTRARENRGATESVRYDGRKAKSSENADEYSGSLPTPGRALLAGGVSPKNKNARSFSVGGNAPSPDSGEIAEFVRALGARTGKDDFEKSAPPTLSLVDGVHLVVDQNAYTLTVYRGGKPFAQYPISLGANGATPAGNFTIHNKIRNPDWYNRGETVPHGDPRNPLGGYWLGFAKDGKPISYGIHPTNDAGAIGQPAGRGCVRLKPEHAEALFRLCPVGATVTIR